MRKLLSVIFLVIFSGVLQAQKAAVLAEGYVRDSLTNEVLPYVSVAVRGTTIGTTTALDGSFRVTASHNVLTDSSVLVVSYLGYEPFTAKLKKGGNRFNIKLQPAEYALDEVVVKPKKEKYTKKGNPAVEFVRNVIAHRNDHRPHDKDFFSYRSYEQRMFAFNNVDTAKVAPEKRKYILLNDAGKYIFPLYNEEIVGNNYWRKKPETERRNITAYRRDGMLDFVNEDGINQYIEESFRDIDLFRDNVNLFQTRFVSPLSSIGPSYYKYYLLDTVAIDGVECMDLGFAPFNPQSFGFVGHLYVALDSTWFVKRASMNVPLDINLNFVSKMSVNQTYKRTSDSIGLLTKNDISIVFKINELMPGVFARRVAVYDNHSFAEPSDMSVFERQEPVAEADDARQKKIDFWTLQHAETSDIMDNNVDELMSDMRSKKMYYWGEKLADILFNGYIQTAKENSKFEIGHVNTFISGNALEGTRLKLGGNTTVNMSRHLFFDTRIAYGTLDKKLKYNILAEYSFNRKKMFRQEFPFHYLRAEYFYDINQIGQHYLYTNVDNLFLKFKRRKNNLITYMQRAELSYYHENYSGFAYGVALRRLREWATPEVPFNLVNADGSISPSGFYTSSQLEFKIRWSPAAKFFQSRNSRIPITADAPIFTLKHAVARKGILGTDHNYNQTEIGIRKRFHLSPFGFTDVYLQAGKVWDKVPYPLLLIPNANLSYTIQPETFTLMDPMEFINDRYVSWEMTYRMNGWLLNRTPLIKWLQLREVLSFRGWYGDLSDKNNAITQTKTGLFLFPKNTYLLGKKPYMEVGVGLENIFKILRLDYVWRLSYRNHEHVPNSGLRMRLQLAF